MTVPALTSEQVREAAHTIGLSLSLADVSSYLGLMNGVVDAYNLVVGLGEADMSIGSDQGGSIRIPASRCGITWGRRAGIRALSGA